MNHSSSGAAASLAGLLVKGTVDRAHEGGHRASAVTANDQSTAARLRAFAGRHCSMSACCPPGAGLLEASRGCRPAFSPPPTAKQQKQPCRGHGAWYQDWAGHSAAGQGVPSTPRFPQRAGLGPHSGSDGKLSVASQQYLPPTPHAPGSFPQPPAQRPLARHGTRHPSWRPRHFSLVRTPPPAAEHTHFRAARQGAPWRQKPLRGCSVPHPRAAWPGLGRTQTRGCCPKLSVCPAALPRSFPLLRAPSYPQASCA